MNVHLHRGVSPLSMALALAFGLLAGGRAEGFSPAISYVQDTTAYNAGSPKVARARCPAGHSVLGGGAVITGGQGHVAIQAAFPTHDDSIWLDVYIVKAAAEEESTDLWSVTAAAFCTPSTVTTKMFESSLFDSIATKTVTIECPYPLKVVGMGGEVAKQDYGPPTNNPETVPNPSGAASTGVVFQGFDVDAGLTTVTAYAIEESAVLMKPEYDYTGDWKLVAFATCAQEGYFDGLERRSRRAKGGGMYDPEHTVSVACSPGKKLMAIGDRVEDLDMGQWFIHRFFRLNPGQQSAFGQDVSQPAGKHVRHTDNLDHLRRPVSRARTAAVIIIAMNTAASRTPGQPEDRWGTSGLTCPSPSRTTPAQASGGRPASRASRRA